MNITRPERLPIRIVKHFGIARCSVVWPTGTGLCASGADHHLPGPVTRNR